MVGADIGARSARAMSLSRPVEKEGGGYVEADCNLKKPVRTRVGADRLVYRSLLNRRTILGHAVLRCRCRRLDPIALEEDHSLI